MPKKVEKEDSDIEENVESDVEEDNPTEDADDSVEASDDVSDNDADDDDEPTEKSTKSTKSSKKSAPKSKALKSSKTTKSSKSKKSKDDDAEESIEDVKLNPDQIKKIIGDFPEFQKNNAIADELAYWIKVSALTEMDVKQQQMRKQQVGPHTHKTIKAQSGTPPLSKTATQFETLTDFVDNGRAKMKTGVQKLISLNTTPVKLCIETFITLIMNEYNQHMDAKDAKQLFEKLSKSKQPTALSAILNYAKAHKDNKIDDDRDCTKKIDEFFENYSSNVATRSCVVDAIITYFQYIGAILGRSLLINKRAMTFRSLFDIMCITLQSFGYTMDPKTEVACMSYAEQRIRYIEKKRQEAKLLSGNGRKGGKGGVGKKMTEKERTKTIKTAKGRATARKPVARKTPTRKPTKARK